MTTMTQQLLEVLDEIKEVPEAGRIQRDDRKYLFQLIGKTDIDGLLDFPKDRKSELISQITTHLEWMIDGMY